MFDEPAPSPHVSVLAYCLALTLCTLLTSAPAVGQAVSNRHQLSACAQQSAPVVVPHADWRTVRLGLPAEPGLGAQIDEIVGAQAQTLVRPLRRGGVLVDDRAGVISLRPVPHQGC